MTRRARWAVLLAMSGAILGFCLWGLFAPHWVQLDCTSGVHDPMEFRISSGGINSICSVRFYSQSRREILWDVAVRGSLVERFTYGQLPTVPPSNWAKPVRQRFPKKGPPRPIERGEQFIVEVKYQYDEFVAACSAGKQFMFEVVHDGAVRPLDELASWVWLPWTDEENDPETK